MSYVEQRDSNGLTQQSAWFKEHRDLQATAMSVDWSGQWVLLAGRRHLALQSLDQFDDKDECLIKYHRNSKYEVSAAEWAICENSQEYCAIATSQLIEVVTWRFGDPTLIHSLRAHTRVVTDIDWHSKEPHLLASCSIDTFTHLWDLRDPRKPIMSLSAVCMSGATQVGFNRVSGNLLATAHDGDLRIWDQRKGSCPIQYITAHLARIHGINWSHREETHLTTASQDGTVKYFDILNPRRAEKIITTPSPVWRARYTPFADGLVTVIVPHLGRGENSLLLWNNSIQKKSICSFVGHTDVILDFAWRSNRKSDTTDMELITWSRDQTLRIWRIDDKLQKMCNNERDDEDDNFQMDGIGKHDGTKGVKSIELIETLQNPPSYSLQHEFSLLNTNIPHIDVEVLDPLKRKAMVRISANGHVVMLQITFPMEYPNPGTLPEFIYCQGTSLNENLSNSLMKVLKTCALQKIKKGRTCLEQCLRALVTALKKSTCGGDKGHLRLQSPRLEGALSSALHDACVPFPKTSGAKFNQEGMLVTFSRPLNTKRISLKHQNITPRALSALSVGYLGNVMGSQPVLYAHRDSNTSVFYLQERVRKSSRIRGLISKSTSLVSIYEFAKLELVSKELASNYIVDSNNVIEMCRHNHKVAETYGRTDLMQCWSLAEMIATPLLDLDSDDCFSQNPFAKSLLQSLILHYLKIYDVQTAALLCCAFGRHCPMFELSRSSSNSSKSINPSPSGSPYHTILPTEPTSNQTWSLASQLKQLRSNSWSDSVDVVRAAVDFNRPILGVTQSRLYDNIKESYAEILYRWGLLVMRAKVLKYLSYPMEKSRGVEFVTECLFCSQSSRSPSCHYCHKPLFSCALCRLPVRGSANACIGCGHGGHTQHMHRWFEPSGSPYHTILPTEPTSNQTWSLASQLKQLRSNSWSDSVDVVRAAVDFNRPILGVTQSRLYDNIKESYAEILYRWGLLVMRAKVLKYLSYPMEKSRGVEFVTECLFCSQSSRSPSCHYCHKPLFSCALCRLPVRGSANACIGCGHGGHTQHMHRWFEKFDVCPTGCGCNCLKESSAIVDF